MKTIKYLMLIAVLPVSLATAGDKGEQEDWMREAIAKERARAQESAKNHANAERLEERFGWLKEKQPDHFAALIAANKKAAEAWSNLANKAEGATNPDALAESKQVANSASADVYLAEMTLRYAASIAERKDMTERTRDRDVAALAAKLDANEKAQLLSYRAKNEAQTTFEKLQNENRNMSKELRTAYDKRDKDRDKEPDRKREHEKEKKNDNGGGGEGGGVLGR